VGRLGRANEPLVQEVVVNVDHDQTGERNEVAGDVEHFRNFRGQFGEHFNLLCLHSQYKKEKEKKKETAAKKMKGLWSYEEKMLALLAGKGPSFVRWIASEEAGIEAARDHVRMHPMEKAYVVKVIREFDSNNQVREIDQK